MEEITLIDPDGNPVACIAPNDENTIYLWSGKPVAYLEGKDIDGFIEGILPVFAKLASFKAFKQCND